MITGLYISQLTLPIYLENINYSTSLIGIISASYYAGMILGALKIEAMICNIRYIRSFVVLISTSIISISVTLIYDHLALWIIARFIGGASLSGLYIVLESWFLYISSEKNKSFYLSIYMLAVSLGGLVAPFLINNSNQDFRIQFIIAIVFLSFSIIFIAVKNSPTPEISVKSALNIVKLFSISKVGVLGCITSGLCIGSIQSFLPLILYNINWTALQISTTLSILYLGGAILQYPIGYLSDKFDRRYIISVLCFIGMFALTFAAIFYLNYSFFPYLFSIFIIGGVIFTLYTTSVSFTCSKVKPQDMVRALQGLFFTYGVGCMIGPLITSFSLQIFGYRGIFLINILCLSILMIYVMMRIARKINEVDNLYSYNLLPITTPVISEFPSEVENDPKLKTEIDSNQNEVKD